ncbi:hypothetical protein ACIBF5_11030 [Micromonospora sp. NPDC050417]|uniref:hypothetical protein n=1 Tax=Micromonospora sp. NPDC050417 TaxID=3364280 RepID=UPI0037BD9C3C
MVSVRRGGVLGAALALALFVSGCGPSTTEPAAPLRVGADSRDGSLEVWPARGALAADPQATAAVTRAVADWRSPVDDRVHLSSSGILWLGQLDSGPVALVAADVPGDSASWLLQLSGRGAEFEVTSAVDYSDPGYLIYSDVLPFNVPQGRRYLTSARVERLLGPDGKPLTVTDGVTEPVNVPRCGAVPITARLRTTESLPQGKANDRLIDLGTGVAGPRYPLVVDDSGSGASALDGLDTCVLAAATGPFGSVPRRIHDREHLGSVPTSWPADRVAARPLGQVDLGTEKAGRLEQLSWHTDAGVWNAVVLRPAEGTAVASEADRVNPLQAYELPTPGRNLVVLVWRANSETNLTLPPGAKALVNRPGLAVVEEPAVRQTFTLTTADKSYQRQMGGQ